MCVRPPSGVALFSGRRSPAAEGRQSHGSSSGLGLWVGRRAQWRGSGVQPLWEAGSGAGSGGRESAPRSPSRCLLGPRHSLNRHEVSVSNSSSSGFTEKKQPPCPQVWGLRGRTERDRAFSHSVQGPSSPRLVRTQHRWGTLGEKGRRSHRPLCLRAQGRISPAGQTWWPGGRVP